MSRIVVLVLWLLLPFAVLLAEGKPNLTGTWELNLSKSDFGSRPGPPDLTLKVRHTDPVMDVTQTVGGETTDLRVGTDGKEYVNRTSDGMELKTVGSWDKDVVTFTTKFDTPGGAVTFKDRLSLESEGKVMKMTRHVTGPEGENDWTLLFEKK